MTDIEHMTCAFPGCQLRLNWKVSENGVEEWIHGPILRGVDEHDPIPVSESQLAAVLVCDFCGEPGPTWKLGCLDFVESYLSEDRKKSYEAKSLGGAWASCDECKVLLDKGDFDGSAARVWMTAESRSGQQATREDRRLIKKHLTRLHREFDRFRTYEDWPLGQAVDGARRQVLGRLYGKQDG